MPETGDFVSGNRRLRCRKRQKSRLFPDTKSPVSGTSVDRPLSYDDHMTFKLNTVAGHVDLGIYTFVEYMGQYLECIYQLKRGGKAELASTARRVISTRYSSKSKLEQIDGDFPLSLFHFIRLAAQVST